MRNLVFVLMVTALLVAAGCSRYHLSGPENYRMVAPVASDTPVFEDKEAKVEIHIVRDRAFSLAVGNNSSGDMKVLWSSSTVVYGSGSGPLGCAMIDGKPADGETISVLGPGKVMNAEVYPSDLVYEDEDGEAVHRPLYYSDSEEPKPADIEGRRVGVKLIVEVGGHTRMLPVMLEVHPSSSIL